MQFLSPAQQTWYEEQTTAQLTVSWHHWVQLAACHYGREDWAMAVNYLGYACDVALILCHRNDQDQAPTRLTLAAIYLINGLEHMNQQARGQQVRDHINQQLACAEPDNALHCRRCLACLNNPPIHGAFIAHHLGVPFHYRGSASNTLPPCH